mgnify:CR=1 FL=1
MMDGMKLRRLYEVPEPAGRFDIGVIKVLACCCKKIIPETCQKRDAQDREQNHSRQERINQYLYRMLVKGRKDFDSGW